MSGDTLGPQAPSLLPARRPVSPRHVLGLTAELLPPRRGAPEPGAGRHVGAGGGARTEHQRTLGAGVVIFPGKLGAFRTLELVVSWEVFQAVPKSCTEKDRNELEHMFSV